ncbi:MAG: hypothetical protein HAW62_01870 [Endozoicomonadaceae bacterium]|nr:hypothetical protein [Endozoicomonadaceae bacterium]
MTHHLHDDSICKEDAVNDSKHKKPTGLHLSYGFVKAMEADDLKIYQDFTSIEALSDMKYMPVEKVFQE